MSLEFKEIWSTLSKISVNDNTEKKGKFTYLSWSWAWSELMKHYPQATYEVLPDTIYSDGTMEVRMSITIGEHTRIMWLPVMGNRNDAIKKPDAMPINKARMRCLVKCIGMFGLGLYIYAGEDLPEDYEEPKKEYTQAIFDSHKMTMVERIKNGEKTAKIIIDDLEKVYTISDEFKNLIKGIK